MRHELRRLPEVAAALETCGEPWEIRPGGTHLKLFVRGQMVLVISRGARASKNRRSRENALRTLKHALKNLGGK